MSQCKELLISNLSQLLKSKQLKLTTAESCTGGGLAYALTALSGSSEWFERGFVTYSNASKEEMLGILTTTLNDFGAVSEETAREMALGALEFSSAQISVAITGIAGPTGGTETKPVGTVWIACSDGEHTESQIYLFSGDRESIREQSIQAALEKLVLFTTNLKDTEPRP